MQQEQQMHWRRVRCIIIFMEGKKMQEPLSLLADSVLLSRYHQGDQRAFEQLVERYQSPLFHFLMRLLQDPDLAWDVMQHVWIQCVFVSFPCQEGSATSLRSWLFQVARNRAIDLLRRRALEKLRTISLTALVVPDADEGSLRSMWLHDPQPGPEALAQQREIHRALLCALASLPPTHQQIVHLRLWQHLSYGHIGQRLGMPIATVKTYFYRSRLRLSRSLANWVELGLPIEKKK